MVVGGASLHLACPHGTYPRAIDLPRFGGAFLSAEMTNGNSRILAVIENRLRRSDLRRLRVCRILGRVLRPRVSARGGKLLTTKALPPRVFDLMDRSRRARGRGALFRPRAAPPPGALCRRTHGRGSHAPRRWPPAAILPWSSPQTKVKGLKVPESMEIPSDWLAEVGLQNFVPTSLSRNHA